MKKNNVNILFTGDFCPINLTETMAIEGKYHGLFNDFHPLIQSSDLSITNLECPLTNSKVPIAKTGPALKATPGTVKLLNYGGFKLVTLANNHVMDFGKEGLSSTFKILEQNEINYVGAGISLEQAKIPFTTNINGQSISVINIAENEFSTTHGDYYGANPLSLVSNYYDIQQAKKLNDIIIVIYHGGNETYNLPSPRLKETLRFFVEAGADAVITHHSHRFSGYEVYKNSPIFYGLGNFIFDYKENKGIEWQHAIAVSINFTDNGANFQIYPISQFDKQTKGVRLLLGKEKNQVINKIYELNGIIKDDKKLYKKFLNFINKKEKQYQHYIEPYTFRILHALLKRGLMPSLLPKKKRLLYLNLIRCESHRDVIIEILKNENRNSSL